MIILCESSLKVFFCHQTDAHIYHVYARVHLPDSVGTVLFLKVTTFEYTFGGMAMRFA